MTCTAKTRDGDPCRGHALPGREVCYAHSGARVGRPSALTPDVHDRIVQAKKAGAPNWVAALSAGISETTLFELLKRGRAEESGPCRELYEATERARGEAYLHAMVSWRRDMGTPGNWRACVAYLDRVDRGRFPLEAPAPEDQGRERAERRPDLRLLSEEQLGSLEALYADTDSEEEED